MLLPVRFFSIYKAADLGCLRTIGRFLQDTTTSNNIDETIINLKSSSKALDENLEALKHNIFFRGYFKKKAKEDLLKKTEAEAEAKKDSLEYWKIKPVP